MLAVTPDCVQLRLAKILQADEMSDAKKVSYTRTSINVLRPRLQNDVRQKYAITIETSPSGAQFLATCIWREDKRIEILNEIDRVNRYNNQSHCVDDINLRPLCYCKQQ